MKTYYILQSVVARLMVVMLYLLGGVAFADESEHETGLKKDKFKVRCESVNLTAAHLDMIPPIGPASGPASFFVGGEFSPATATVELLGPPMPQPDGTLRILVQLQYDFGGGDVLFAFSRGRLTATDRADVFANQAQINYTGGTGKYEMAYGRFDGVGILNFADFKVDMAGMGEVCNLAR